MANSNEAVLFRCCATHYLCQWLEFDRRFAEGAKKEVSTRLLQEFFTEYKVIRQFPGKNHERLAPIARELNKLVGAEQGSFDPIELVNDLVEVMKPLTKEGKADCISAASKAAWITVQSPVFVFDSRSRVGLQREGLLPKRVAGDYASFWRAWATYRERTTSEVTEAISWLAGLYARLSRSTQMSISQDEFLELIANPWFQDRVVDFRLLLKGDPNGEDNLPVTWMPAHILINCLR